MAEVKEAPKPKTENGPGQTTDIEPRTSAAPMTSHVHPFAFMRRFAREMDRLFEEFGLESGLHLPRLHLPRFLAERMAWSAPGVTQVENLIAIAP